MAMSAICPYRAEDIDALLALIEAITAPERVITAAGLRSFLSVPGYDPARDLLVAPSPDGARLLGARDVRVTDRGDEEVLILESWGGVHPEVRETDLALDLLRAALDRAGRLLAERGRTRGILQARCGEGDAGTRATFAAAGLAFARSLATMLKRDQSDVEPSAFRPGIDVLCYRPGVDDEAWVAAFNDAFGDHWGGFMGMNLPLWRHYLAEPDFNPTISVVAWDGDDLAGFCHCRIDADLNAVNGRRVGMIRYVGVRPRWRSGGLGKALTRAGLLTLRDAGMDACVLGVDTENVTGAHHLYARLGFEIVGRQVMYRAEIDAVPPARSIRRDDGDGEGDHDPVRSSSPSCRSMPRGTGAVIAIDA